MTSFAATWPLLLTLIKSVALLVVLLIFIAYVLYADRKIWAAVQLRRGPNVVGPFWDLAKLRRLAEIRLQGAGHPRRRQ
jgi:NADH:ubiquinone oxidoreductase subunit H